MIVSILNFDWLAIFLNIISGWIFVDYIFKVTKPTVNFIDALGPEWFEKILPVKKEKLKTPVYRFPWAKNRRNASICHKDVAIAKDYGTGKDLLCDIWEPSNHISRSGVSIIHLHATAWQGMEKGQLIKPLFTRLNDQGHLILDLAYSLAPESQIEEMVFDVKLAISWLKQNSTKHGLDPDKVVLLGESGGGHLALLCAYTPNHQEFQSSNLEIDTSVCGVIAVHAPTDLAIAFEEYGEMEPAQPEYSSQIQEFMKAKNFNNNNFDHFITKLGLLPEYRYANMPGGILLMVDLMGGTLKEIPEKYEKYSPITHVDTHSPPTLYLTGEHDWYYPGPYGRLLDKALKNAGRTSIYVNYPMTDHGFALFLPRISPAAQNAYYTIEHFIAAVS